ncbi:MAG: YcxB family protein [Clostridiaceae bacterium]|nr:YcxB family protein [Clostridiaceae bacterium]
MEYVFVLSKYNEGLFKTQVSKALEKRTELVSRQRYPKLWRFTDKMNSRGKVPEEVLKKRHVRYRIYGIILMIVGLFVLIPSLVEPKELLVPLLVGALSVCMGIIYFRQGRKSKKKKLTSFDKAAVKLFTEYKKIPERQIKVIFTDDEVKLEDKINFAYSDIENIFITEDLIILIWNKKFTVLQKKDLSSGNIEEFISFITNKSDNLFEVLFA